MLRIFGSLVFVALLAPLAARAEPPCEAMTGEFISTHTRPPRGEELLHAGETRYVTLKAVFGPDGIPQVDVSRSSGITALNDIAAGWVRSHWRWPHGCAPGTTRRIMIGFHGW